MLRLFHDDDYFAFRNFRKKFGKIRKIFVIQEPKNLKKAEFQCKFAFDMVSKKFFEF